jgi:anti-sigma-K factor RskA
VSDHDEIPAELREIAARLSTLGREEWDPPEPPPLRLPPARPGPAARRWRGRRRRPLVLRPAVAVAAATALLAVGAGAGVLLAGGPGTGGAPGGRDVTLAPVGDGPRGARADARLDAGTMHLTVTGLPRVPAGGFYEVWMLRDPRHLVAVGSFRVGAGGEARLDLPVAASSRSFPVLDISREPADGDPAHSGHSVLRSHPIHS